MRFHFFSPFLLPLWPRADACRIDILVLREPFSWRRCAIETHPGHHPSSRKSVRIGESSSIKGPISDDKDLEMNGPRHSNGSLSPSTASLQPFSAIPLFPKQPRIINYISRDREETNASNNYRTDESTSFTRSSPLLRATVFDFRIFGRDNESN